jgi:hypothetical protein
MYKASVQKHPDEIDADDAIKKFVKDVTQDIARVSDVKILPDISGAEKMSRLLPGNEEMIREAGNVAGARGDVVYLGSSFAEKINKVLTNFDQNSNCAKNKIISILQHEAGHIRNNDTLNTKIVDIVAPLVVNALDLGFGNYLFDGSSFALFGSWQYPVFSWFQLGYKFFFTALIQCTYSRYQERRADSAIKDNLDLLSAAKEDHEKSHKREEFLLKSLLSNKNISLHMRLLMRFIHYTEWFFNFFSTHPSHSSRAKNFEQRIVRLKSSK